MEEDRRYDVSGHEIERRSKGGLSDEQFYELRALVVQLVKEATDGLAEEAKKRALASLFEDVGRGAVAKILSAFGFLLVVVFVVVLAFLIGKEHINLH